jgi:hypothetical protein
LPSFFASVFKRSFSFRRVVSLYRRRLSQKVFAQCGGIVRYGPFTGMRWLGDPNWGLGEQGAMVLGLYEQEVLQSLSEAPSRFQVFVDVGAADGYYAVGMLHAGKVAHSIAFEIDPESQKAIARLAAANGVADRITILGAASDQFVETMRQQKIESDKTMFLFDIEGYEFKVLTEDVFAFLRNSLIIVETHAHIYPDPPGELARLIERSAKTHRATSWHPGPRNPWTIRELDGYPEIDRWILCSEGRFEPQQWLRFDPL